MLANHPIFNPVKYKPFGMKQYVYTGSGCIEVIPEIMELNGWKKVLFVIDPGVLKFGTADKIIQIVKDAGYEYDIFSEIKPNPHCEDVEKIGHPMYRKLGADVMIAIGGGSTMDSAKGIAMMGGSDMDVATANDKLYDLNPYSPVPWEIYPIIAIPTTMGTGSEVMRTAVISEPNGHKLVPMHDCITPKYAIEDPDLLASLPAHVAAYSAMDSLVQGIESYVSRGATDFSEMCALHGIELMGPNMVAYVRNPSDKEVAAKISLGSMYTSLSWNGSFVCQVHGCNHPITEILHISHGDSCALLLPWFVEWNGENAKEKFWKVRNAMYPLEKVSFEEFSIPELVERLMKLNYDLNIMDNLTMDEYVKKYNLAPGCDDATCDLIIDSQFTPNMFTFPRKTSLEQMKQALRDINRGKYIWKPEDHCCCK